MENNSTSTMFVNPFVGELKKQKRLHTTTATLETPTVTGAVCQAVPAAMAAIAKQGKSLPLCRVTDTE